MNISDVPIGCAFKFKKSRTSGANYVRVEAIWIAQLLIECEAHGTHSTEDVYFICIDDMMLFREPCGAQVEIVTDFGGVT